MLQVVPCLYPIFGLVGVKEGGKQTLAHVLRDMHEIKAMRHAEDLPVWQVPENRPHLPYLQQRLWLLLGLSRHRALLPVIQQLVDLRATLLVWDSSELDRPIEQMS